MLRIIGVKKTPINYRNVVKLLFKSAGTQTNFDDI